MLSLNFCASLSLSLEPQVKSLCRLGAVTGPRPIPPLAAGGPGPPPASPLLQLQVNSCARSWQSWAQTPPALAPASMTGPDRCCPLPVRPWPPPLSRGHHATGHKYTRLGWSDTLSHSGTAKIVFPSVLGIKVQLFYPGFPGLVPRKGRIFFLLPPQRLGHFPACALQGRGEVQRPRPSRQGNTRQQFLPRGP